MTRLARRVFESAQLTGRFVLRSGRVADEYFDKFRFEADPKLAAEIADRLSELVPVSAQAIAGVELGGVPLAALVSQRTGLPARFVRKAQKTYGTCALVEGGGVAGLRLAVVDDVLTTGGQLIESCASLRAMGADVAAVLCVVDREEGGAENLAREGLALWSVFTMSELRSTPDSRS